MPILKNGKHELFAQKWHELDNKTEAYRLSHPTSLRWKAETVQNKGCALSKQSDVLARYQELQKETSDNHGITIDTLLKELDAIKALAMGADTPQCSAAVSSVMSKAKLVGLDIVKIEISSKEEVTPWGEIKASVDKLKD